jgi:hypothetical protein
VIVVGVSGVLLALGGVIGWRMVTGSRALPLTDEICDTDPTVSGFQGWCVQTRHRDAGLVTDEVTDLYIVAVQDGQKNPRAMRAPFPFADPGEPYSVLFEETSITVTGGNGARVTYPSSLYQVD